MLRAEHSYTKVAMKIYWPEVSRVSEVDILKIIEERGANNPDIEGHIPKIICSDDLGHRTDAIRLALGLMRHGDGDRRTRTLRVIVFELQIPITDLEGEAFVRAWMECVRCESAQ